VRAATTGAGTPSEEKVGVDIAVSVPFGASGPQRDTTASQRCWFTDSLGNAATVRK
jgi:hypothetical protein